MTVEDAQDGAGSFQALDDIYVRYQQAEKLPGLAFGIVSYAVLKLVRRDVSRRDWLLLILAALFVVRFVYLAKG